MRVFLFLQDHWKALVPGWNSPQSKSWRRAPGFGTNSLRYAMAAGLTAVVLGGVLFWRAAPLYRGHMESRQ